MKILFHNYHDGLNDGNRIFASAESVIGDGLLRPFQVLHTAAQRRGVTVGTRALIAPEEADAIVFIDLPDTSHPLVREMLQCGKPLYLIVLESVLVRPPVLESPLAGAFERIFTYDDSLIDGERFIKINYTFDRHKGGLLSHEEGRKLCVMIAGNKRASHPQELYSERVAAIRWFEAHHPEEFDLYGVGWDERDFGATLPLRLLNRFPSVRRALAPKYPSYRGQVERKRPVLERYRFAICYENVRDVPGYVTEKIFDALLAGCVPVYLGAGNVTDYIPADCFIDRRAFPGYRELYDHLSMMTANAYRGYLEAIRAFLAGDLFSPFSCETFARTILNNILIQGR
ncbi:glycosyltransferase family 10 [Geomonas sp. RF6]|uniref:glycosyltransferase family 10 domain-containing protein n=1 Tax=Geomonas sp. RF6 TaxID=2897342 RepID=UPI001E33D92A|nr:glycosyltransferase family 10 [Geomonas sp. RF6]UFS71309.1 glycosyltransferase family 10 [Geomonas sp. RF6]